MTWPELAAAVSRNGSFLISSHASLDGDCVGTEVSLYWYLRRLSKDVVVFNNEPVPQKFAFLNESGLFAKEKPGRRFDVLMIVDCSNPSRLAWEGYAGMAPYVINIDHHRDNTSFGQLNIVRADASATGQLIYEFFLHEKLDFPPSVAEALYTAILTDTGGFRFSNTNGTVFKICADLSDRGARCSKIYDHVYASLSREGLLLQARIWSTLSFYKNGAICSMEMPYGLIEEVGAAYGDTEGMADQTILASGVEVGMLIKHSPGQTHFSLRSKGVVDVGKIAKSIEGGGGHSCAAGCTMSLPVAEAKKRMIEILSKELD